MVDFLAKNANQNKTKGAFILLHFLNSKTPIGLSNEVLTSLQNISKDWSTKIDVFWTRYVYFCLYYVTEPQREYNILKSDGLQVQVPLLFSKRAKYEFSYEHALKGENFPLLVSR